MSQSFNIKVNETYDFNFSEEEVKKLDLFEKTKNDFHVLKDNESFDALVLNSDFNKKKYSIQVNGNHYDIVISDKLDQLITQLGLETSSGKKENEVKAPMPGLIVSVEVKEGEAVKEGEGILVLEAMKMENNLVAPKDGMVKAVHIKAGDKVEKNALLIEIE